MTGPKGVIKDWQRFKQLEAEKRASQSLEKMQLAQKLSLTCRPQFGRLVALHTAQQFLDAVDQEHQDVTVIVHLYDERTASCRTMNDCLATISRLQPHYKFCKLRASTAGVSKHFSETGVPALIIYKGGAVIGNFVRLEDELGDDFCSSDLENFLIE
ncbi:Phosducin-like protein [Amphibalanus amphitrite]|uniref:Phosducin-like protein n=1 Tax=Amphibalanus amphitrite TaxID=1232801 RepID=A0A6A4VVC9_AMPAM|nr:Phosducin-like protein [Amphibalanus amphitrite]